MSFRKAGLLNPNSECSDPFSHASARTAISERPHISCSADDQDFQTRDVHITPHPNVITEAGEHEYYSADGKHPLPYAIAELIDNSLQATKNNAKHKKQRKVRVIVVEDKKNSFIACWDNGHGMSEEGLRDWAVMAKPKSQEDDRSEELPENKGDTKRFLNSNISFFGVGSKQAAFFMGGEVTTITKERHDEEVRELCVNKAQMLEKYDKGQNAYQMSMMSRKPNVRKLTSRNSRELDCAALRDLYDEKKEDSFTLVIMRDLKEEILNRVCSKAKDKSQQADALKLLADELAHIYHYYLHGPDGNVRRDASVRSNGNAHDGFSSRDVPQISVERVHLDKNDHQQVFLGDINDDRESLLLQLQVDKFEFKAELPPKDKSDKCDKHNRSVQGVIYYYPNIGGIETLQRVMRRDKDSDDDLEEEVIEDIRSAPVFECFWNGRLIPKTTVERLDFCSLTSKRTAAERDKLPDECYSRIRGMLFFNNSFKVTRSKMSFQEDIKDQLNDNQTVVFDDRNIQKRFRDWLRHCHESYDQMIIFDTPTRSGERCFEQIQYGKTLVLKKGAVIKVDCSLPHYAALVEYFQQDKNKQGKYISTGVAFVRRLPDDLYGDIRNVAIDRLCRQKKVLLEDKEYREMCHQEYRKAPSRVEVQVAGVDIKSEQPVRLKAGEPWPETRVTVYNATDTAMKTFEGKVLTVTLTIATLHPVKEKKYEQPNTSPQEESFVWRRIENVFKSKGVYELVATCSFGNGTRDVPAQRIRIAISEGDPCMFKFAEGLPSTALRLGSPGPELTLQITDSYGNECQLGQAAAYRPSIVAPEGTLVVVTPQQPAMRSSNGKVVLHNWRIEGVTADATRTPTFTRPDVALQLTFHVAVPNLSPALLPFTLNILPGLPETLEFYEDALGDRFEIENRNTLPTIRIRVVDRWKNPVAPTADLSSLVLTAKCDSLSPASVTADINASTGMATFASLVAAKPNAAAILAFTLVLNPSARRDATTTTITRQKLLVISPSTRPSRLRLQLADDVVLENTAAALVNAKVASVFPSPLLSLLNEQGNAAANVNGVITTSWTSTQAVACTAAVLSLPALQLPTLLSAPASYCVRFQTTSSVPLLELLFSFNLLSDTAVRWNLSGAGEVAEGTFPVVKAGVPFPFAVIIEPVDVYGNPCKLPDEHPSPRLVLRGREFPLNKDTYKENWKIKRNKGKAWNSYEPKAPILKDVPQLVDMTVSDEKGALMKSTLTVQLLPGPPTSLQVLPDKAQCHTRDLLSCAIKICVCDDCGNLVTSPDFDISMPLTAVSGLRLSRTLEHDGQRTITLKSDEGIIDMTRQHIYIAADGPGAYAVPVGCTQLVGPAPSISLDVRPCSRVTSVICSAVGDMYNLHAGMYLPTFSVCVETEDRSCPNLALDSLHVIVRTTASTELVFDVTPADHTSQPGLVFSCTPSHMLTTAGALTVTARYTELRVEMKQVLPREEQVVCSTPSCTTVGPGRAARLHIARQQPSSSPLYAVNTGPLAHRRLLDSIDLFFVDAFGNRVPRLTSAPVEVSLRGEAQQPAPPLLDEPVTARMVAETAMASFGAIAIQENSGVADGDYSLVFHVPGTDIQPCSLPVTFSHSLNVLKKKRDIEQQRQGLLQQLRTAEDTKAKSTRDVQHALELVHAERQRFAAQHLRLGRSEQGVVSGVVFCPTHMSKAPDSPCPVCNPLLDAHLSMVEGEIRALERRQPREARIRGSDHQKAVILQEIRQMSFSEQGGVVGIVADLACVDDRRVASVLSWHLSSNLLTVVVKTRHDLDLLVERIAASKQRAPDVLALDMLIPPPTPPTFELPLPSSTPAPGLQEPPYLLHHLRLEPRHEYLRLSLFFELIGKILLFDNLTNAMNYRQEAVKLKRRLPTLLTLQGDRLTTLGTVSGDKARPLEELTAYFGESRTVLLPQYNLYKQRRDDILEYHRISSNLSTLLNDFYEKQREQLSVDVQVGPKMESVQQHIAELDHELATLQQHPHIQIQGHYQPPPQPNPQLHIRAEKRQRR